MLAIRRTFAEAARGNRLNLDGEHGHGGERYGENEFLHVNLRRFSNRHRPPWRARAVLNRRTPDGSAAMHPTQGRRFVRRAPTLWRARPARPVLRSSVQVPCNHSCEAIAPVRLISVHSRRNLNGDSLMHSETLPTGPPANHPLTVRLHVSVGNCRGQERDADR
jgi:hypothetical protein